MTTWWEDYLRDPGGTVGNLLRMLLSVLTDHAWQLAALLASAVLLVGWWSRRRQDRLVSGGTGGARHVTVLAPPSGDPHGGEALWGNLVGLLRSRWRRAFSGQPHVVWELLFSQTGVQIRLWVPGSVPPGLVERAVEAAWPGARTRTTPAEPPLPARPAQGYRVVVGGELRLARAEGLPLRTDFDADPVRALLTAASGLGPGEHACVQILARPAAGRRLAGGRPARPGRIAAAGVGHLLDVLTPGPIKGHGHARRTAPPTDRRSTIEASALDRATVTKRLGSQYATTVRYAVAHDLPAEATSADVASAYGSARGRAHALASTFAAYSGHNRYQRHRLPSPIELLARRRLGRGDLLSLAELAALAHLPLDEHVPGLARAGARAVPPPPPVLAGGPDTKLLGDTDSGHSRPVALRVRDARHHLHVVGATGSGKSTLLARLALDDADAGRGLVLIDPKGDLVTDVLARLPRSAVDRVVLFDADSRARPPCLNPLDTGEHGRELAVENLVSVFRRIHAAYWGPRTDDIMRAACLTVAAQPGVATLTDMPKLLVDPAFRDRLTGALTDPILRGFWQWYDQLSDAARAQAVSPLMNKLRAFLLRPFVRDALAAGASTVDMSAVLDGGICLVRIPKGSLGDETTRLVGSLTVAAAWHATTARAGIAERDRRDASLVVDECHNFLNLPYAIEDMIAEARALRLSLTLAHQHLGQLNRELREGLSTNARTKIYFTAGPEDARDLARHTAPHVTEHDLAHLGAFHAAARLVVDGAETAAFTLRTRPLPPAVPGRAAEIRRAVRPIVAAPVAPDEQPQPAGRPAAALIDLGKEIDGEIDGDSDLDGAPPRDPVSTRHRPDPRRRG